MSVDYSAYLVVGVLEQEIFSTKKTTTYVTKYNQDTGKPYEHPVIEEVHLCCGTPMEEELDDRDEWAKEHGLHYCNGNDGRIYGRILAEVGDESFLETVPVVKLDEETQKAREELRKLGYYGGTKIYLVMDVG